MSHESDRLKAIRDIAARADGLCEEMLAKLCERGLVSKGRTRQAVERDREFKLAILPLFLFTRDLFRSIRRLEGSDSLLPCRILARSLFQAVVNLIYIGTDPPNLAHRFLTHDDAQRYRHLLILKKLGGHPRPSDAAEIESRWQQVKPIHGTGEGKKSPNPHWHGRNLRCICHSLKGPYPQLERDYHHFYKPDSDVVHASVQVASRYVSLQSAGEGWELCRKPTPSERVLLLTRCAQHLLWMVAAVEDSLSLGLGKAAQQLQREIKQLAASSSKRPSDGGEADERVQ